MKQIHLIYTSLATGWPTQADLEFLLAQSRRRNKKLNITGMLLYKSGVYLQILEGDSDAVHEVFDSIQKDRRNTQVTRLVEEEIIKRDFPDWSMAFRNMDKDVLDEAYSDIFNGNYDRKNLYKSKSLAVNLVLAFSNNK